MSSLPRFLLRCACLWLLSCLAACTSAAEKKAAAAGLVDVRRAVPGISVDLRYATADNITGRPLYSPRMPCLLRASTAARLKVAQERLRPHGYGLRVWDAWRPLEAHQALYQKGASTGLFLNPERGWSRHCGGVSVDVTLVDLRGREVAMPSGFDDAAELKAASQSPSSSAAITSLDIRHRLNLLNSAMEAAGFKALPGEWWHYDDLDFLYTPVRAYTAKELGLEKRISSGKDP